MCMDYTKLRLKMCKDYTKLRLKMCKELEAELPEGDGGGSGHVEAVDAV